MTPEHWRRLSEIFHAALERPAGQRITFVRERAGDETLAAEIESLLEAHAEAARAEAAALPAEPRSTVGRYRIERRLGEGGMGVVYAARHQQLGHAAAIKFIAAANRDPHARERLRREARALARVQHPGICRIYEVGEDAGEPYIAMELLEGESLADRLRRGALPIPEAVRLAIEVLHALEVLHRRGIVHRDLKPSNIFLTAGGVKLLDFGLARETAALDASTAVRGALRDTLTRTGAIIGTPHYMAPEQILGTPADARADIFSMGVLLFEMTTGKPPFDHTAILRVLHAIAYEQPPVLTGSPAVDALDRIIQRAMAKNAADRYPTAAAMAADLQPQLAVTGAEAAVVPRAAMRLAVLPFQLLQPDLEIAFLGRSLAEAIVASLTRVPSLIVRSSGASARFSGTGDLPQVASQLDVDIVITGTLVRSGDVLRVHTEMIDVPRGTVLWSHRWQVTIRSLFQIEDEVTERVLDALAPRLTEREHRLLGRDVPHSPRAYEFYLRGVQQGHGPAEWQIARDLYRRAVDEDPRYAPAWARLARAEFLIAKYTTASDGGMAQAEAAVRRALELNPALPLAQHVYAQIQLESGRSQEALVQLALAAARRPADADLFAAIVHTARYCGLLDVSLEAHARARRIDPAAVTSVAHTHFAKGDYEAALAAVQRDIGYIDALALVMLGREDEASERLRQREQQVNDHRLALWLGHLRAALEGKRDEAVAGARELLPATFDPEARLYLIRLLARLGADGDLLPELEMVVERGFYCLQSFQLDPWLDPVRADPRFARLLETVKLRHEHASAAFAAAASR